MEGMRKGIMVVIWCGKGGKERDLRENGHWWWPSLGLDVGPAWGRIRGMYGTDYS